MVDQISPDILLKRIDALEREIEYLRRDLLRSLAMGAQIALEKPTLFGSVRGGDVTDEMIEESKRALFRSLEDL
jgi:hypothetical protein